MATDLWIALTWWGPPPLCDNLLCPQSRRCYWSIPAAGWLDSHVMVSTIHITTLSVSDTSIRGSMKSSINGRSSGSDSTSYPWHDFAPSLNSCTVFHVDLCLGGPLCRRREIYVYVWDFTFQTWQHWSFMQFTAWYGGIRLNIYSFVKVYLSL